MEKILNPDKKDITERFSAISFFYYKKMRFYLSVYILSINSNSATIKKKRGIKEKEGINMAAILLSPVYVAVNIYVIWRIFLWMGTCSHIFKNPIFQLGFLLVYLIFATSILTGFLIKRPEKLRRALKNMGNYFLGIFLYALMPVCLLEILGIIARTWLRWKWVTDTRTLIVSGILCMALVIGLSIYGVYNAKKIRVTSYHTRMEKKITGMNEMKIVLIADLHLGYNSGEKQVRKIVEEINRQKPDLVCVAGDLFDNEFEAVKDPEKIEAIFREIKSTYGVYGCWGNHDVNEPILAGFTFDSGSGEHLLDERMDQCAEKSGIIMLNDEIQSVDGKFYIVGRKDVARAKKIEGGRKNPQELLQSLDHTKPIFVIDHQPKELQELADAGADFDLCGHTHGGQMFPGNFAVDVGWENACGCLKKGKMYNIVTSGAGIWGPNMRIGSKSEICVIHVQLPTK